LTYDYHFQIDRGLVYKAPYYSAQRSEIHAPIHPEARYPMRYTNADHHF
jgi:hypothetical protein